MSTDDVATDPSPFRAALEKSVDAIADKHLDRQVSLRLVVAESIDAYVAAWNDHRSDEPLDIRDATVRADVSAFVNDCVESVGEPENPQFPVRRS